MKKKHLLAVVASTLMFAACGDDVTEVNEIHQDGMAVLDAGEKLSKQACDTTNVGEMLFVTDSAMVFVCDGESWQTLKGEKGEDGGKGNPGKDGNNGTSCTAKSVKNAAGIEGLEVTCGETVIDTIWNGKNGQNGNNGTSCIAEPVKNAAGLKGLEVTCDNAVIDTIWNGKDGQNGNDGTSCTATVNQDGGFDLVCDGQTVGTITNGEDGVGCTLDDEGDGKVTVSCGKGSAMTTTILYKAVCGTVAYDPAKSFCSEGTLYSCGDKPYDPAKSFCSEGEAYDLCDGKTYDPAKSFCSDGEVYDGTFSLTLWDAAKGNPQVSTGHKSGGLWYDYANSGSEVVWGAELGADGDKTAVLEACGGICGNYTIGGTAKDPYLGVAFDYDSKGNAADASAMKGVCVMYSFFGDNGFALELGMTQDQEDNLGSALPMVTLPAGTKKTMDFAWSEFEQPEWAEVTMKGTNAAKQLKSLKFKIVDPVAGDAGAFTIFKVGPMGSCN